MKKLVIPDIHNKVDEAEAIIKTEDPDTIYFLGDYFDDYGDSYKDAQYTGTWLHESLKYQNRVHLMGNHDISYREKEMLCGGWSQTKQYGLTCIDIDWSKIYSYAMCGEYLLTHASLTRPFYDAFSQGRTIPEFLKHMDKHNYTRLWNCGVARGGIQNPPGIFWCDWEEFEPIPNQKQIFGHTADSEVRSLGDNYCIDTHLRHYIIIDESGLSVKKWDR